MAINSYEKKYDINIPKLSNSKTSNLNLYSSMKIDYATDTVTSSSGNRNKSKRTTYASPYLTEDRIQLLSRVTEKSFLHKKTDFLSSFPLAVKLYKANSDEFRTPKKCNKKVKKSVLTLPNEPTPLPQACTVSDMNESEYFDVKKDVRKAKPKKRKDVPDRTKTRGNAKQTAIYNRDEKYCSQLDIGIDGSSTDIINKFTGDNRKSRKIKSLDKSNFNGHDVWSVLRNVNQFQFTPSPPMSHESIISVKRRKKINKPRSNRKDTRLIETCRTEEFSYISSFVDNISRNSYSQSSFDRITVIEKQDEIKICNEIEGVGKFTLPCNEKDKRKNQNTNRSKKIKTKQNHIKTISPNRSNDKILEGKSAQDVIPSIYNFNVGSRPSIQNNEIVLVNDLKKNQKNKVDLKPNHDVVKNVQSYNFDNHLTSSKISVCSKGSLKKLKRVDTEKKSPSKEPKDVTGITKVVLSKGQNIVLTKQAEPVKRKQHLTTIEKSVPKITSVVTKQTSNIKNTESITKHYSQDLNTYQISKSVRDTTNNNKDSNNCVERLILNDNKIKVKYEPLVRNDVGVNKPAASHTKPMRKIKDKMMQFIHKRCIPEHEAYCDKYQQTEKAICVTDAATNTRNIPIVAQQANELVKKHVKSPKNILPIRNYPKPKGKWASEFIENIIKKIKTGVYYSQDNTDAVKKQCNNKKENFVQTEINSSENIQSDYASAEDISVTQEADSFASIPGFDNSLSDLEIETLNNCNQVAVRHCLTNVVIEFDVTFSPDANRKLQIKKSLSFITPRTIDNQSTIFKCKTNITNAILPAELCSILPQLMKKIISSNSKLNVPSSVVDKVETHLSTISELTNYESNDNNKCLIPVKVAPQLKPNGTFTQAINAVRHKKLEVKNERLDPKLFYINGLLTDLSNISGILIESKIIFLPFGQSQSYLKHNKSLLNSQPISTTELCDDVIETPETPSVCTALQSYDSLSKQLISVSENYSFSRIVELILSNSNFNMNTAFKKRCRIDLCKTYFHIKYIKEKCIGTASCSVTNDINAPFTRITENVATKLNAKCSEKVTDKIDLNMLVSKAEKSRSGTEFCIKNTKNKKRNFINLYKKCKSMSSISSKCTSLDKITNLDEFFLAMGSGKVLSSVLDGNSERKILSSIKEMKNWMTDITHKQALLVLLLTNKKDTTNLVRYRPLILQGIAVNRITRASELDMEIEVIERENLNKLTQYEGITYLPASEENQDSLLEELYWIAKTTASDYQKPFDASSERLLKSLLEKRKKLNPSYLRVMARYVGLGLLKSTK